ncbi:hypothetical protein SAMN06296427_10537 [Moheibacter sediminis]|uniref:Uncharacterized protein n=1 Tax=Moheibacter sediminis TaxID=1434700 RepID=A0A1W2ATG8_9FLAO|nr:hypothetical protein SAMN06296427_10537 [Moheibacter sediminis]
MIIVEIFTYIFVEIIFQGIILGIIKLFKRLYNFLFPKKKKDEFMPYREKEKPSRF